MVNRTFLALALGIGVAVSGHAEETVSKFFDEPAYLGAHRGGGDLWPEGTVLAYTKCAETWPECVLEADVRETKDGHVVVLHDATVDRTTDGMGPIEQMTLEEAQSLDAGYDFSEDGGETFPYRGKGHRIATLAEALEVSPESRWLIETKDGPDIVAKTLAIIREMGMEDRVLLASFNPAHMALAKMEAPGIARCYDTSNALQLIGALRSDTWDDYEPEAHCLSLMQRHAAQAQLTPAELGKLVAKGIYPQIHTLNTREQMDERLAEGYVSILTDRPDILAEAVADFTAGE